MKRFLAVSVGALMLALGVAACGSDDSSTGGTSSGAEATGSSETFPELQWASVPVPRADPVTYFNAASTSLVGPVEQSLMNYTPEGEVVPGLAESMKNPNPTTYIYKLKPDVKFSDGKPVTGEDVLYSLQRNMGDESQTAANFESVASISLANDDEIVFKLKQPDVSFENVPALAGQVLQKAAAVAGGESKIGTSSNLPVGSGPYKFASFNPQQGATLVPNPYWEGEPIKAEKVSVVWMKNDSALALAMRSGEVAGNFFPTSREAFENLPGTNIVSAPGVVQVTLSMNTLVAPFDDPHVRKAIAYATNREGIAQALFGGEAEIGNTLAPKSVFANVASADEVDQAFETLPGFEYDLAAAEAEMAKSKYPDGATITYQSEPGTVKAGQVLQPDLEKIGLDLQVEEISESKYLEILYGPRDKQSLMVDYYGSTFPDPSALLNYWLSPEQAVVNGLNSANYKNPKVGKLLDEQSQTADGKKRLELLTEISRIANEDVPYVPLAAPEQFIPLSDDYVFAGYSQWTANFGAWPLLISKSS